MVAFGFIEHLATNISQKFDLKITSRTWLQFNYQVYKKIFFFMTLNPFHDTVKLKSVKGSS